MTSKKQTTKNKILETTIELLNEKGISNVTMRDVSQKLDISVGNLTYHYPKWELLIDDIFIRYQADIEEMYKVYPYDISEVVAYINKIYAIQIKYTFLFSNFYIFFRLYPKYKEINPHCSQTPSKKYFPQILHLISLFFRWGTTGKTFFSTLKRLIKFVVHRGVLHSCINCWNFGA